MTIESSETLQLLYDMNHSLGFEKSFPSHEQTRYCNELQEKLIQNRHNSVKNSDSQHVLLPRSTKVDGRFILTKEHFPNYIDYGSLSDIYKWRTECEPAETYTEEYLEENLPVMKPDREILARGTIFM